MPPAYQFGSEFGPARIGCGIFRDVRIEGSNIATIENLHLRTIDCNQHYADIRVALQINRINKNQPIKCKITLTGGGLEMKQDIVLEEANNTASTILHIERPFLWWPRGYGVQHLYHVKTELLTSDGQLLDCVCQDFGVRTIRVEKTPEKTELLINDRPIRIKGADWMPVSQFPGTETPDDYEKLLKQAKECHINLLRVHACGFYENPAFYEMCDRMGILVWQDFMFDSAYYPDRQWFTNSVKNEAEAVIKKLRNHACIALWCGNNNIDWLHKNGKLGKGRKFYGKPIFHKLLPKLINELDPDREYIPTRSCCNSENQTLVSDTPAIPSPPCLVTLRDSKHYKDSLGMLEKLTYRSAALEKIAQSQIAEFLPPKNLSEYIWQSQVVQARHANNAVERFRALETASCGCIAGALNDFALSISPSMLDSLKQPKALYYYARRFFAPILVTILPDEKTGILKAYIVNDSASPVTGMLTCQMIDTEGLLLDTVEKPIRISPFSKTTAINLPKSFTHPDDPSRCFLYVCIKNNGSLIAENTYFYCPDKQFKWPIADLDVEITPENDKNIWNVTLVSETLVRDLQITPPQPAALSDNF
ncbi:MAG: beta-mannosidase [Planctomycetota bacterium]